MTATDRTPAPDFTAAERARLDEYESLPAVDLAADVVEAQRQKVIADVLAAHESFYVDGYLTGEPPHFTCGSLDSDVEPRCTWESDPEGDHGDQHRAHVAAEITTVLAAMPPADEALRERVEAPWKDGDPDWTPYGDGMNQKGCGERDSSQWRWICTREPGHPLDWHVAGDGDEICAVWPAGGSR